MYRALRGLLWIVNVPCMHPTYYGRIDVKVDGIKRHVNRSSVNTVQVQCDIIDAMRGNTIMNYVRQTQRLGLRKMTLADSPLIVRWRNQDWVREHYIYREQFTLEGQESYYHSKIETGLVTQFIVCELDGDRPIGCTVLNDYEGHDGHGEYGMFLGEVDAAGHGYSAEMVRMTLDYGFQELGLTEIIARIFTDNMPSIKGCNRGGMQNAEILKNVACSDGTVKDMQIVCARKSEFYHEIS